MSDGHSGVCGVGVWEFRCYEVVGRIYLISIIVRKKYWAWSICLKLGPLHIELIFCNTSVFERKIFIARVLVWECVKWGRAKATLGQVIMMYVTTNCDDNYRSRGDCFFQTRYQSRRHADQLILIRSTIHAYDLFPSQNGLCGSFNPNQHSLASRSSLWADRHARLQRRILLPWSSSTQIWCHYRMGYGRRAPSHIHWALFVFIHIGDRQCSNFLIMN